MHKLIYNLLAFFLILVLFDKPINFLTIAKAYILLHIPKKASTCHSQNFLPTTSSFLSLHISLPTFQIFHLNHKSHYHPNPHSKPNLKSLIIFPLNKNLSINTPKKTTATISRLDFRVKFTYSLHTSQSKKKIFCLISENFVIKIFIG